MNSKHLMAILVLLASALACVGCGDKESDPQQKIDAPGYYNGPMKARGNNASGENAGDGKQ